MKKIIRFGKGSKLADVILADYNLITVISRFGIKFGFGEADIEQICKQYNINSQLFLEVLSSFHDPDYESNIDFSQISHNDVINYLLKSHNYYRNVKIPYIENLLSQLSWENTDDLNNKSIIKNFFAEYTKEVFEHTGYEEKEIFPYIYELHEAITAGYISETLKDKVLNHHIRKYKANHGDINSALLDLKNLMLKFLPSPTNQEIANIVLIEIFNLENDLKDHAKIEETILVPKVKEMENLALRLNVKK